MKSAVLILAVICTLWAATDTLSSHATLNWGQETTIAIAAAGALVSVGSALLRPRRLWLDLTACGALILLNLYTIIMTALTMSRH